MSDRDIDAIVEAAKRLVKEKNAALYAQVTEKDEVDMAVGAAYGVKWLNRDPVDGMLVSPQQHFKWRPGRNEAFSASRANTLSRHGRFEGNSEGFYSISPKNGHYDTYYSHNDHAVIIKHSGLTAVGSFGYRSQYGEIVAIVAPGEKKLPDYPNEEFNIGHKMLNIIVKCLAWGDRFLPLVFGVAASAALMLLILGVTMLTAGTVATGVWQLVGGAVSAGIALFIAWWQFKYKALKHARGDYEPLKYLYPGITVYETFGDMVQDPRLPDISKQPKSRLNNDYYYGW